MPISIPIASMSNMEAKRSLLLQYQRAGVFADELLSYNVDKMSDITVDDFVKEIQRFDTNIGLTLDRIKETGG